MCPSASHVSGRGSGNPESRPPPAPGLSAPKAAARMNLAAPCCCCCCAAKERRLGKGLAFRLCLLSATLLLCLQLLLRRSWDSADAKLVGADAAAEHKLGGRRAQKASEAAANRRQVTYVRSGRRRSAAGPTCSLQGAPLRTSRKKTIRWQIDLQPWASPVPSLSNEALRFLKYINTTQMPCDHMNTKDPPETPDSLKRPWSVCLDDSLNLVHRMKSKQCRLYSLGYRKVCGQWSSFILLEFFFIRAENHSSIISSV